MKSSQQQGKAEPIPLHALPITQLTGVGASLAKKLEKLHIHTVQDALLHLPSSYQDRNRITAIGLLRPFQRAVIEGEVQSAEIKQGRKTSFFVRINDGTGTLGLRYYFVAATLKRTYEKGARVRVTGEVRLGQSGLEMYHPEYLTPQEYRLQTQDQLTPIYPTTDGLSQQRLRQLMNACLDYLTQHSVDELVPRDWLPQALHIPLVDAIKRLHVPSRTLEPNRLLDGTDTGIQRLALEELVAHQVTLKRIKQTAKDYQARVCPHSQRFQPGLMAHLPFELTQAQRRVAKEIGVDMSQNKPMLRLLQGDVGSGKTLVAALAALQCIEAGFQVALMAPTELLAQQHYHNFHEWLEPLGVSLALVNGKLKGKQRQLIMEQLATGSLPLVIGTHALFQNDVIFKQLVLVIIDEQHRFGVHQRVQLAEKGQGGMPHQLIMTATPIPRTLAMSAYADLDTSVIDEMPAGRKPVQTSVLSDQRREQVVARLKANCLQGHQAYWVCTLIEESETLTLQAAEDSFLWLQQALPELRLGLVHGRMKTAEKNTTMAQFKAGELQVLVATTVIEVGVDVPNANIMVIENPERLGLAQLHQLRGRIGRGQANSFCVLLYKRPLSQVARERLEVIRANHDGFAIAEKDLELRGPGEVLGTRQTGLAQFKVADLVRDQELLEVAGNIGNKMLSLPKKIQNALVDRWVKHTERFAKA